MATSAYWWEPVFTSTFTDSEPLFRAYLFVIISRLLFPVPVLTALGHTRMLVVFGGIELLLNIAFSFLLAPAYGLLGIIWATVLAYLLDKLLLMYYLYRRTGIRPSRYLDLRWYGGYVIALLLVHFLF
jgi:O-antigen/teichoic acid export membrane protein